MPAKFFSARERIALLKKRLLCREGKSLLQLMDFLLGRAHLRAREGKFPSQEGKDSMSWKFPCQGRFSLLVKGFPAKEDPIFREGKVSCQRSFPF